MHRRPGEFERRLSTSPRTARELVSITNQHVSSMVNSHWPEFSGDGMVWSKLSSGASEKCLSELGREPRKPDPRGQMRSSATFKWVLGPEPRALE